MKLTLLAALCLSIFIWSPSALANTVLTPDVGQAAFDHGGSALDLGAGIEKQAATDTERNLNTCGTITKWDDLVVVEVKFDQEFCFQGIYYTEPLSNATWTNLMKNPKMVSMVKDLETAYKATYEWMQGQDIQNGDYGRHCDPYGRKVTTASVQNVSVREGWNSKLAVEMKITSTCMGCGSGLPGSREIFDLPTSTGVPATPMPTRNCVCPTGTGDKLVRAPYESEFMVQFQQVVQLMSIYCLWGVTTCSYGTPFSVDMEIDIDVNSTSLTETQRQEAVQAFIRASNSAYTPSADNCQPEFRRLEQSTGHSVVVNSSRRHTEEAAVEDYTGASHRELVPAQRNTRMKITVKTTGSCNGCLNKAFIGNRPDNLRIVSTPKFRQLQQQVYDKSNCYCPVGSSVAQEPIGVTTLMRLFQEELNRIGSPIKNVTSMMVVGNSTRTVTRRVRRLQGASPPPPATRRSLREDEIPDPPSICPMIRLNFDNLTNPLAHYDGQSATFQAGDYVHNQLWWSHGINISASVGDSYHRGHSEIFVPQFIRGTGWVSRGSYMTNWDFEGESGGLRLLDTMRPSANTDPRYHQPLCTNSQQNETGPLHLGSPNRDCPGGGPGLGLSGGPDSIYSNCVPQGLVAVFQRGNKPCPEDSPLGGIINFYFREPVEFVKAMRLLKSDGDRWFSVGVVFEEGVGIEESNGLKYIVVYPPDTGVNGLYTLPFKTDEMKRVREIRMFINSPGAVVSLEYPYCAKTPTTNISVKKYVGPPGLCTASGISSMQDSNYTVTFPNSTEWAYCYEVSIPSDSEDCLFDITLNDPAPMGGTNGRINVTAIQEKLCPGQTRYVAGQNRSFSQAPEGWFDATVEGYGYYTNALVSSSDGARVLRKELVHSVSLIKFAGPPAACTNTGFNTRNATVYTVPTNGQWAYCYRISIAAATEECMRNITLLDPAPKGGTNGNRTITTGNQTLCPGTLRYVVGPTMPFSQAPEGPFNATLEGVGIHSGRRFNRRSAYSVAK